MPQTETPLNPRPAEIDQERRGVEQWFRRRGLPAVVRGRPRQLLVRSLPAVVWLALSDPLQSVLEFMDGDGDFEDRLANPSFAALYLVMLLGALVVPAAGAGLAVLSTRRWVLSRRGFRTACLVTVCYMSVWPVLDRVVVDDGSYLAAVIANGGAVVIVLVLTVTGVGSISAWALRAALRQLRGLGAMTSRSLPMLLLVTTFGFFTTEIWQTTGVLTGGRVWLVIGFFGLVGATFLLSVFSAELEGITGAGGPARPGPAPTRLERANMVLVLLLTQVLQALVFGVLVFVLFVVLGWLAVPRSTMTSWAGHAVTLGEWFGVQLPVPRELLQVCMFIAAFSALFFIVTVVTDAGHRRTFFDPVLEHLKVSLAARASYLDRFVPGPDPSGKMSPPPA